MCVCGSSHLSVRCANSKAVGSLCVSCASIPCLITVYDFGVTIFLFVHIFLHPCYLNVKFRISFQLYVLYCLCRNLRAPPRCGLHVVIRGAFSWWCVGGRSMLFYEFTMVGGCAVQCELFRRKFIAF